MMRAALLLLLLASAPAASADIVVAAHTIRAQAIIQPGDLIMKPGEMPGVAGGPALLVGQEARVALYAGRPIRLADVGPPAVIERNQLVPLIFMERGLRISAEGRSLARAGAGEVVRVMNMSSRATVSGRVMPDGRVMVSQ